MGQQLGIKAHTAKNQYWKFETNIPRKGIARPQSRFPHLCVCERLLYSHHRSAYSATGNMWTIVERSWAYINRSQTHECGNWDWGRVIPRKRIHKWDFRCSAGLYTVFIVRCVSKKYHAVYLWLYKCLSRPLLQSKHDADSAWPCCCLSVQFTYFCKLYFRMLSILQIRVKSTN